MLKTKEHSIVNHDILTNLNVGCPYSYCPDYSYSTLRYCSRHRHCNKAIKFRDRERAIIENDVLHSAWIDLFHKYGRIAASYIIIKIMDKIKESRIIKIIYLRYYKVGNKEQEQAYKKRKTKIISIARPDIFFNSWEKRFNIPTERGSERYVVGINFIINIKDLFK